MGSTWQLTNPKPENEDKNYGKWDSVKNFMGSRNTIRKKKIPDENFHRLFVLVGAIFFLRDLYKFFV